MNINPFDSVPKPMLWICCTPFVILLLPLGILWSSFNFFTGLWNGVSYSDCKDNFFDNAIMPGVWVGLAIAILLFPIIFFRRIRAMQRLVKDRDDKLILKEKECEAWIEDLALPPGTETQIKLYPHRGRAVGRIIIWDGDESIRVQEPSLPDDILLDIFKRQAGQISD